MQALNEQPRWKYYLITKVWMEIKNEYRLLKKRNSMVIPLWMSTQGHGMNPNYYDFTKLIMVMVIVFSLKDEWYLVTLNEAAARNCGMALSPLFT